MLREQVASLVNDAAKEYLGESALLTENLENVVDIGTTIFNNTAVDNYVKSLINHIGRVVFVNRPYSGRVPSVLMDSWEFGSVLEKIQMDLPDADVNESWELYDGQTYNQDIFYKPSVSAKFFNQRATFEIPLSFTELQVKESFSSGEQLNAFVSMIYNAIEKAMTIRVDGLIMRTIDNFIGQTLYNEYPDPLNTTPYASASGVRAVNLLKLYNDATGNSLTAAACLEDKEFIRYATIQMDLYISRLREMSSLFNIEGKERFTPTDLLHVVMLANFESASKGYLQSDTFHKELVALPKAETVNFWQGSGTDYALSSAGVIDITIKDPANGTQVAVASPIILAVMFDNDALGVSCYDRRTTTHYNAKGEFINNYFKSDAGYFNDLQENFVCFFVA